MKHNQHYLTDKFSTQTSESVSLQQQKLVNQQLKDQNTKLIESLKNMKSLVTTMFNKMESMQSAKHSEIPNLCSVSADESGAVKQLQMTDINIAVSAST